MVRKPADSTNPQIEPLRKLPSRPVLQRGAKAGVPGPVGPGLCGILDLDFGEFAFHALG